VTLKRRTPMPKLGDRVKHPILGEHELDAIMHPAGRPSVGVAIGSGGKRVFFLLREVQRTPTLPPATPCIRRVMR
jgi:hypothetical protein